MLVLVLGTYHMLSIINQTLDKAVEVWKYGVTPNKNARVQPVTSFLRICVLTIS